MVRSSFIMLIIVATGAILFGCWESAVEMQMVLRSEAVVALQQRHVKKLLVENQDMRVICKLLLSIFLYDIGSLEGEDHDFQQCLRLAGQKFRIQVALLESIMNLKEPVCHKTLSFWINGDREDMFRKNVEIVEKSKNIVIPWHRAAKDLVSELPTVRSTVDITQSRFTRGNRPNHISPWFGIRGYDERPSNTAGRALGHFFETATRRGQSWL